MMKISIKIAKFLTLILLIKLSSNNNIRNIAAHIVKIKPLIFIIIPSIIFFHMDL